ncbi:DUF1266 domain-containing protein [Vagococcus salmoninarum]|uniref:DUF1266 domain-containing protein n=1 Tax=Vagococcus salmoninarum TaxID=2739 RepID=UPI003F9766A7
MLNRLLSIGKSIFTGVDSVGEQKKIYNDLYILDRNQRVLDNPPPTDKRHLLPCGGIYILHNEGSSVLNFTMAYNEVETTEKLKMLADSWGFDGRPEHVLELLNGLARADGYHVTSSFENDFWAAITYKSPTYDKKVADPFNQTYQALPYLSPTMKNYADLNLYQRRKGLWAWDLERGAFLARTFHGLGYLSDTELMTYLETIYSHIQSEFQTWEEYASSFMYGRTAWGNFYGINLASSIMHLFTNPEVNLYQKYPLNQK